MPDDKDQFERWIDEGARRYVAAEPPLGMEARVLARLEERQRRRVGWRPWMFAIPVAAVLLVAAGLSLREKTRPQPAAPQVSTAAPQTAAPAPPIRIPTAAPRQPASRAAKAVARAQKPQQFPSPEPPSQQERLLARLAQDRAATTVVAGTAKAQENVVISRITIAPVEIPLLPATQQGE